MSQTVSNCQSVSYCLKAILLLNVAYITWQPRTLLELCSPTELSEIRYECHEEIPMFVGRNFPCFAGSSVRSRFSNCFAILWGAWQPLTAPPWLPKDMLPPCRVNSLPPEEASRGTVPRARIGQWTYEKCSLNHEESGFKHGIWTFVVPVR